MKSLSRPVCLSLDSLHIGQAEELTVSITDTLIDEFAGVSGDVSALHTDVQYATQSGFDGRVAHGALIVAVFSRVIGTRLPGNSALVLTVNNKFHSPVISGSQVLIRVEVESISQGTSVIGLKTTARSASGERLVSGRWMVKVRDD